MSNKKIETTDDVEEYFGITLNNSQYIDILNYLVTGTIPEPDGCTSCDRHFVRTLIGKIQVVNGE